MSESSRPDRPLDPTEDADVVVRTILRGLFSTLLATLDGVRANEDPEPLHDLRVATRRIRSVLTQVRGVFPEHEVADYKARFAWLQGVTGPVRDLDVYLLGFETDRQCLPAPLRPCLEPLHAELSHRYDDERGHLLTALDSDAFVRLIEDWRVFLDAPVAAQRPGQIIPVNARRPIKAVADAQIRRLAKRVRREGRAIRPDSPPEALHALRKHCKKLRYLMEFFQGLYPKRDIRQLIDLLKTLLDQLGHFQDLSVQARYLTELARHLHETGQAGTDTLLAMGALIGRLLERQQVARDAFDEVFAGYLDPSHQRLLRALF
ncbi:CHAD domain-containing protein [Thiobaca trueperi]|uniref:CHAD domain-containing protein n=1 Tax=Thiobaca trueperi TaxID=127458 RepID=A0A4R3MT18_9GAMM|nr:CHAD domain-containing protein [Thiobaca trueperi]TCT19548.1 CHAD domain-containing protein [Thiobaca trueperi]